MIYRLGQLLLLLVVLALTLALCSCEVAKGNRNTGDWMTASLGRDASDYKITADGMSAATLNESESVKVGGDTIKDVVRIKGLLLIGEAAVGEIGEGVQTITKTVAE